MKSWLGFDIFYKRCAIRPCNFISYYNFLRKLSIEKAYFDKDVGTTMNNNVCEYCKGTVRVQIVEREVFKHKNGFVILEKVPLRICDSCGSHYYPAKVLHKVDEIAKGRKKADRTESVPIAVYEEF